MKSLVGLVGVLTTFAIAGVFAMISITWWSPTFYFVLFLVFTSISVLLFIAIWRFRFSNRSWYFRTSDDKKRWYPYFNRINKAPEYWQNQNQEIGMFYEIDFGREYKIVEVHFACGYTFDAPIESNIWFFTRDGGHVIFKDSGLAYKKLNIEEDATLLSTTKVQLDKPKKAQKIMISIVKPDMLNGRTKPWRVEAVYLKIQAYGLIKHTIGKFFLDKW